MKKKYIAPAAIPFNLRPSEIIAESMDVVTDTKGGGSACTKEEDEESSSIWDLYN